MFPVENSKKQYSGMTRRECLKAAAYAAGGLALLGGPSTSSGQAYGKNTKTKVSFDQLDKAANQKVLHLDGIQSPMIIDSIEWLKKGDEYIVRVRSKDGAEGIAFDNKLGSLYEPILKQRIIPFFIGRDARMLEEDLWELYRFKSNYKMQGQALWCPTAWVEFAILDMLGRACNKSYGQLLGGTVRDKVPFYVASGRRDTTPQQEIEYLAKLLKETGAKAVKFRVGGRMSRDEDAMPGRTEELIPLVRKTFGDSIDIHGDANSSYGVKEAIRIGRMLEDVRAVHYEEPCQFDHLEETKEVADKLTIPVAIGEQESSEWRFRWVIANRGAGIVQPDLNYYGGMIRSRRVAQMADAAGIPTTLHISNGFGFIYMLHFISVTPKVGRYQEYKRGIEKYSDWFDPPLKIADGAFTVPRGPGVGIKDIKAVLQDAKVV
jgi:L-alanine-DL-glutamate epimerase-like enolase superfamily enzyme